MKDHSATYRSKLISIEEAVSNIKSGMEIVVSQGCEPQGCMQQFHTLADKITDVKVFSVLTLRPYDFFTKPEMKGHFELCSWFHGAGARGALAAGSCCVDYVPNFLHHIGTDHYKARRIDIFFGTCTPPDKHGFVCFGLGTSYEKDIFEKAKIKILEVSPNLPRLFGDTEVHVDDVDFFVEYNTEPPLIPFKQPAEIDLRIGEYVAELVEDESTIQLGIGEIPNAVAHALEKKRDLGVHTEMMTDSMMTLYDMGVITNKKKAFHKGKFIAAFVFGSKALYEWCDNNVAISFLRGPWVNSPAVVSRNSKMVSINTCMMVDFTGQIHSEGLGFQQYSGTGGQFDTAMGAREGIDGLGKSIIACHSTAKKGTISTIVPFAPPGTSVTLVRNITDYVVTEYGAAWLRDKTVKERTKSLISIAHPDFREQLKEEARKMGYM
jgi:acyl-CoA hydrolase